MVLFVIFAATVVSLFVRRANAGVEQRQQIKWFAYAAVALLATVFLFPFIAWWWPRWVGLLVSVVGLSGLPVSVGIAILRRVGADTLPGTRKICCSADAPATKAA